MTLRDPEILEVLHDEPELLALADAVTQTQRRARSKRARRMVPRAIAVAGVAAAILVAVLLVPGGNGNHAILGRALAAIGDGRVLHLVMRVRTGEVLVDLKSGRRIVVTARVESWSDRDFGREHLVMRIGGRAADLLLPEDRKRGGAVGPVDPAFDALWTGYRRALATGAAKLERKGLIAGRPVYWLRFPRYADVQAGTEVAIDARTYKPVLVRSHFSRVGNADYRVLTAETIPFRAADFRRVGHSLLGDGGGGSASSSSTQDHVRLKAPWLTAGSRVAGLRLASVQGFTTSTRGRSLAGVELVYGATSHGFADRRHSLTINELAKPEEPGLWSVPRGFVSIQQGEGSDRRRVIQYWIAQLVKHGIYVTIETGAGERAVVEAARALHPAP